jgi:hypothetical protein
VLDLEELSAGLRLVASELGMDVELHDAALRASLRESENLAEDVYEMPAALCYALGRNPRALGHGFHALGVISIRAQALASGVRLNLSLDELAVILGDVREHKLSYESVRDRFAENMHMFAG